MRIAVPLKRKSGEWRPRLNCAQVAIATRRGGFLIGTMAASAERDTLALRALPRSPHVLIVHWSFDKSHGTPSPPGTHVCFRPSRPHPSPRRPAQRVSTPAHTPIQVSNVPVLHPSFSFPLHTRIHTHSRLSPQPGTSATARCHGGQPAPAATESSST